MEYALRLQITSWNLHIGLRAQKNLMNPSGFKRMGEGGGRSSIKGNQQQECELGFQECDRFVGKRRAFLTSVGIWEG
jgi:hypothetical protein